MFGPVLISALLIAVASLYACGWLRLRTLDFWRAGSFLLGLFLIWLAAASPLAALDHQLLTAHMVQHLLLMTLAPPLVWLGAPVIPLQQGLPRKFVQVVVAPLSRSAPIRRIGRALTHPAVCWLGATVTLIGWHIPAAFALGMQSEAWHGIEQASFLATGLLFWWPVIQPWPGRLRHSDWSIPLYLFLATLPCDILSGFLVFCDYVVYGMYFSSLQPFGLSAIQDQQYAGALMWTVVTIVYVIAGAIFTVRLLSPDLAKENMAQNSASAWDVSGTVT
jgi:cytochrome c oxidase assembly factor CtaG